MTHDDIIGLKKTTFGSLNKLCVEIVRYDPISRVQTSSLSS
jgi:hypothetical protein